MQPTIIETVPLTENEKIWLLQIYEERRRRHKSNGFMKALFAVAFIYLMLMTLFWPFIFSATNGDQNDKAYFIHLIFSNLHIKLPVMLIISGVYTKLRYYGWILPYKKDALSGVKYMSLFLVTRKEYFPITGQHFITIKCHQDKRFEVNDSIFYHCEEGGHIALGQAVKSGYIFCDSNIALVE